MMAVYKEPRLLINCSQRKTLNKDTVSNNNINILQISSPLLRGSLVLVLAVAVKVVPVAAALVVGVVVMKVKVVLAAVALVGEVVAMDVRALFTLFLTTYRGPVLASGPPV